MMKLYSAWYCPFAQRTWMALEYKGLDYDYIEVDPYHQSDWWLEVSRGASLVPVVVQPNEDGSETTIVESNRTLEYLEDFSAEPNPIFDGHPNARAEQKYWMDHIDNRIMPFFYRYLKDPQEESKASMIEGLEAFIGAMDDNGPYFTGDRISAVDIAFMPFAYRIVHLLGHYRNVTLPTEGNNGNVSINGMRRY